MGAGVVLDTSFLITLAGPDRPNYAVARRYWQYFMEQALPVFLPTIVVSEFYVRQEIPPDILRCCIVLPFNWGDAIKTAELDFSHTLIRIAAELKAAGKVDFKTICLKDGFDRAFLDTNGQRDFDDTLDQSDDKTV